MLIIAYVIGNNYIFRYILTFLKEKVSREHVNKYVRRGLTGMIPRYLTSSEKRNRRRRG